MQMQTNDEQNKEEYFTINKRPKDDVSDDNDGDDMSDEVAQLKQLIQYKQREHEKVMKEYMGYKQATEEERDRVEMENRLKVLKDGNKRKTMLQEQISIINKEYDDVNNDLKKKYEQLAAMKVKFKAKEDAHGKYDQLLKEFNEYKEQKETETENDEQKEDTEALHAEIEKLKQQNGA